MINCKTVRVLTSMGPLILFLARRDITAGEEILINYNGERD